MMLLLGSHQGDLPCLHVVNIDGRIVAKFDSAQLDQKIRAGQRSTADLLDTTPDAKHRLIRRLILLACAQSCQTGMACLAVDCPLRPQFQAGHCAAKIKRDAVPRRPRY
ncbi:MAG: hypothetical protein ACYC3A_10580 [Halothiobacillus sp.]